MPSAHDRTPYRSKQHQNDPHHDQDDPQRPQNMNSEQKPSHQQHNPKDDHNASRGVARQADSSRPRWPQASLKRPTPDGSRRARSWGRIPGPSVEHPQGTGHGRNLAEQGCPRPPPGGPRRRVPCHTTTTAQNRFTGRRRAVKHQQIAKNWRTSKNLCLRSPAALTLMSRFHQAVDDATPTPLYHHQVRRRQRAGP